MRPALATTLLVLLTACTTFEPFEPPVAGELNPEPGLFTGPAGEFVLHRPLATEASEVGAEAPMAPAERRLTDPPPP
jgi:hypothetical protein